MKQEQQKQSRIAMTVKGTCSLQDLLLGPHCSHLLSWSCKQLQQKEKPDA
jgi:hypothetical protein